MKKILITIMAVVFVFSMAAPAMAKGAKVPKELCLKADGSSSQFILGMKKGAKIMYGETKLDMYSIQATLISLVPIPASGAGYLLGDNFAFQISSSISTNINIFGVFNLLTELGTVTINITSGGGFTSVSYDLIPCDIM